MKSPVKIKEAAYEKQNRAMRAEHKRDTGKTLGKRLTKGTNKRRVSFACRFAGMAGACLLYTSPSPRDGLLSRMPSSA